MITKQISFTMPVEDFQRMLFETFLSALQAHNNKPEPKVEIEFIPAKEAAKLLKISRPSLRKYTRNSLLKGYRMGNTIRYRRDEIERAFSSMQSIKHSRNQN